MAGDSLVGTLFAGRFQIESLIGSGGMGSVYLARHAVLQRSFALKVLRRDMLADLNVAGRFRREARALSRLDHPNILRIFDFGHSEDGRPYLAMEYITGPTLDKELQKGHFPPARALTMLAQIADALHAAHASHVIHRDLKPSNIIITTDLDGQEVAKVLDFGLAKIVDTQVTAGLSSDGRIFGTPEYVSPERCLYGTSDSRSDIYSLGIIAFELLTGWPPFRGKVIQTLQAQIKTAPPVPSAASGRIDIPPRLDSLVLRCLAKSPDERYQTAREIAVELRRELRSLRGGALRTRPDGRPATRTLFPPPGDTLAMPSSPAPATGPRAEEAQPETLELSSADLLEEVAEESSAEQDTMILKRDRPSPPRQASREISALEELALSLRDRGLGTPDIIVRLSLLVVADDQLVAARSALTRLEQEAQSREDAFRFRQWRLGQMLSQLQHELNSMQQDDPACTKRIEKRILRINERIQQLTAELDRHLHFIDEEKKRLSEVEKRLETNANLHREKLLALLRTERRALTGVEDQDLCTLFDAARL